MPYFEEKDQYVHLMDSPCCETYFPEFFFAELICMSKILQTLTHKVLILQAPAVYHLVFLGKPCENKHIATFEKFN